MARHYRPVNIASNIIATSALLMLSLSSPAVIIKLYVNNQPSGYSIDVKAGGEKTTFNRNQQPEDSDDTELLDWLVGHFSEDERNGFDEPDDDNPVLGENTTNNIYRFARALHKGDRLVRLGDEDLNMKKLFVNEQPPQLYFHKQGLNHFSSFEGDVQVDPISKNEIRADDRRATTNALIVIRQRLYPTPTADATPDLKPAAVVEYAFTRTTGDDVFPAYINIYRPESVGGLSTRLNYMRTAGSAALFQNQLTGHISLVDSTINEDFWLPHEQLQSGLDIIDRSLLFGLGAAALPYIGSGLIHMAGATPMTIEGLSTTLSSLNIWKDAASHAYATVPLRLSCLLARGASTATTHYCRKINDEARPVVFTKDLVAYTLQHNHNKGAKEVHSISPFRSAFCFTSSPQVINTEIRTRKSQPEAVQGASHNYTSLANFQPIHSVLRKRK
ncbi:hypothetical protein [Parendozoicomonas haliclonae]|uniref:Uncharacterized protein n=1 Tax=Parendozoicomonas haliclonae TaxID=1960125 RepID=A0A1X7ALS0_9GAMM|nr:hypothetical protein [Parendozoicomonas haliclonae]SMA49074.1 hypothetical protein EHSB41UT_03036 [Parendozoicomonas haliclonae]